MLKYLSVVRSLNANTLFIGFLLSSSVALGESRIEKYDLKYHFSFQEKKVFCTAKLSLNSITPKDTLNLLLYRLLKVKSIKDESGKPIQFDEKIVAFSDWEAWQVNSISVFIGNLKPFKPTRIIIVEFEGFLRGYAETGANYLKDNINPAFTILRSDSYAYPVQGVPSFEKNRAKGLRNFEYIISVTVPDSLTVINGGKLLARNQKNNSVEYIYQNLKPAWRIDITIAKYSTFSDHGLFVHYFPEDSAGAKKVAENIKKCYSLYTDWLGEISFSGYSIIEIPDNWGSQADVTCILQTSSAFKNENNIYEVYHELSHVWNVIPKDKDPCRLESEGLAIFLQYLAMEKLNNRPGLLDSSAANFFGRLKKRFQTDSTAAGIPIIEYGKKQMTDLSYSKGMIFFYVLYKTVGHEDFMKTLTGFYDLYRAKGATTEDFSNYLVKNLDNKKVPIVINEWIFTDISSQKILKQNSLKNLLD